MRIFIVRMTGSRFQREGHALMEDFDFPSPAPVELQRDPDNRHDANAIKVMYRGVQLGWVDAQENSEIAALLDDDFEPSAELDPDKLLLTISFPDVD